jgi:hypothetical protein
MFLFSLERPVDFTRACRYPPSVGEILNLIRAADAAQLSDQPCEDCRLHRNEQCDHETESQTDHRTPQLRHIKAFFVRRLSLQTSQDDRYSSHQPRSDYTFEQSPRGLLSRARAASGCAAINRSSFISIIDSLFGPCRRPAPSTRIAS